MSTGTAAVIVVGRSAPQRGRSPIKSRLLAIARRLKDGTSPITKASGTHRIVLARNKRLADALHQQAFAALSASTGARALYDHHRARGATHSQAVRTLSNLPVGLLDG